MAKFEYHVIVRDQAEKAEWVEDKMNSLAKDGWRPILVSDWFFCWERPVDDAE